VILNSASVVCRAYHAIGVDAVHGIIGQFATLVAGGAEEWTFAVFADAAVARYSSMKASCL
jgi:hypothetical protein